MLKHEPTEVDKLPLPSFEVLKTLAPHFASCRLKLVLCFARNEIASAVEIINRVILTDQLKLSEGQLKEEKTRNGTLKHAKASRAGVMELFTCGVDMAGEEALQVESLAFNPPLPTTRIGPQPMTSN